MNMNKISKKSIVIRTDGSNEIGMGHIFRSLYLGNEFKKNGYMVHFITSNNFKSILNKIGKCHVIDNELDEELKLIKKIEPQFFVLDLLKKFFPYNAKYFLQLQNLCQKLIAIDFVSPHLKYFDLSFHTLFGPKNYRAKKTFYDFKYSIVSNNFKKELYNYKIKKNVSSVIVLCGGSDTHCICPKIISSLDSLDPKIKLNLIIGPKFECWKALKKEKNNLTRSVKIFHNVKNIEKIMKKHDVAISFAGVTMTELLTIGIPSLIIYGHLHEKEAAELVDKKNLAINLGYGKTISKNKITKSLNDLILNFNKRNLLNKNSNQIFDGEGTERLVKYIISN